MARFSSDQFPRLHSSIRAKWAPVFLSPISGSPERFVIGVVAVSESDFHVEPANSLERFQCLYGRAAETAKFAAALALDEIAAECADRGVEALTHPQSGFLEVSVGRVTEAEDRSLEQMCQSWLAAFSSLHDASEKLRTNASNFAALSPAIVVELEAERAGERLPALVFDYVKGRRSKVGQYFSAEIREHRERRRRSNVHGVLIDFSGVNLVANFGTLRSSTRAASADGIKRRMWDLMVSRDSEGSLLKKRTYEMIVQHPEKNDPQVSEKQFELIQEAVVGLADQASREEIRFSPMTNVQMIGDHLLEIEGLRAPM